MLQKLAPIFFIVLLQGFIIACSNDVKPDIAHENIETKDTLHMQVLGNFNNDILAHTQSELSKHFKWVKVSHVKTFPAATYYAPRKRYKADTIISHLAKQTPTGMVTIALTLEDICTKKGAINDYGIMGLGYCPGRACVVSTFRLKKTNLNAQFYKLCLHELGHTAGLPHCEVQTCFMRDAEGKNHFDEEIGFCSNCKTYLNKKAWNLE